MARPDDAVQSWLSDLPMKYKRELAQTIREQADRLAEAIKDKAPVKSGATRNSVTVRRKRNELELEVTAGGDLTTKQVRAGSGVSYDYVMATEFGTSRQPAQPFFYTTAREMMPDIRQAIEDKVDEVTSKA